MWTGRTIDLTADLTASFELRLSMRTISFAGGLWRACTEMISSGWYSTNGLDLCSNMLTSQSHLRQQRTVYQLEVRRSSAPILDARILAALGSITLSQCYHAMG